MLMTRAFAATVPTPPKSVNSLTFKEILGQPWHRLVRVRWRSDKQFGENR
jgi:hypothetical protein